MTPQPKLSVYVENFGPVRRAEFELSPLTIFIGPNNSGKSYMALLVYALSEALLGRVHGRYVGRPWGLDLARQADTILEGLDRWLAGQVQREEERVSFRQIPDKLRAGLLKFMNKGLTLRQQQIGEVLRDYFGCATVQDLVRLGDPSGPLAVISKASESQRPLLDIRISPTTPHPRVRGTFQEPSSLEVGAMRQILAGLWTSPPELLDLLWAQVLRGNGIAADAYYLPAARSGILQGWPLFASGAMQALRKPLGPERTEVPPFTGVAGDFLQVLWERVMQRHPGAREAVSERLRPVLQILEDGVFGGEVSLETKGAERDLILYRSKNLSLPLNRASSMVAELAPLVLWTKYLLAPGDLLIIDEPEAHLHPENQRRVARALVRLVNAGVRVLCTTHSPTILHQVSNHVLAGEASARKRAKLGFSAEDLLKKDDLGVYLFDVHKDGTHVSEVPVEAGFGIPEDEFVKVAETIGDETYGLTSSSRK